VHKKETLKILPDVVPVESVPVVLKLVPQVNVNDDTPLVVITKVIRCPIDPPDALKVQAPVGVMVIIGVTIFTVIVPVEADVDEDAPEVFTNGILPNRFEALNAVIKLPSIAGYFPLEFNFTYCELPLDGINEPGSVMDIKELPLQYLICARSVL